MAAKQQSRDTRLRDAGADVVRIAQASVLVVADDVPSVVPAWALCRALGALGFGAIELHGADEYAEEFRVLMHGTPFTHRPLASSLSRLSRKSAPSGLVCYLGDDARTRDVYAAFCRATRCAFRAISFGATGVRMESRAAPRHARRAARSPTQGGCPDQLPPLSRVAAGLALQEAIILAGRLGDAAAPSRAVDFDASTHTYPVVQKSQQSRFICLEEATIDVVGAGGIGTNLLESLAPLLGCGCEVRIFDFDEVGPENLAVQSAFSPEDVGRPKATVMAEKVKAMCDPTVDVRPWVTRYEYRPRHLSRPHVRIACPDTFAARKHANDSSLRDGVPLVEAATSPLAAQHRTYVPGRTACLAHRIPDLRRRVAEERDRAACGEDRAITLPGTNMICGGILALEAVRALEPEWLGTPSLGTVVYDARFPQRFGIVEPRPPCVHRSRSPASNRHTQKRNPTRGAR